MKRWGLMGILVALVVCGCRGRTRTSEEEVLVASATLTNTWIRNFNPFSPNALWPTQAGIFEPMLIYNTLQGQYVPWLAEAFDWMEAGRRLRFKIRKGVLWSDGTPFSAEDVVYTFELLRLHRGLDTSSIWSRLKSLSLTDEHTVEFELKDADFPALAFIAHQMIVPKHQWQRIKNPVTYANPTPIGTGPYTEVVTFRTQLFELGRNPHYWQREARLAKKMRMPAYTGNDTVSLALVSGEIDWAGHTIPMIEKTYRARDPEHFHYWFPPFGGMVFLYANTAKPPFNNVLIRKALNHAIDRTRLTKVGMSGYAEPALGTGLSPTYEKWACCQNAAKAAVTFNLEEAKRLLRASGCQYTAKKWMCDSETLEFTLEVVSGWTDWIRTAQLIKSDLEALGIHVTVKPLDFGAWFDHMQTGQFELSIGWSNEGVTPYEYFRDLTSSQTRKAIGESSAVNWHRFGHPEFDKRLAMLPKLPEGESYKRLVNELQSLFMEHMPAIPLFPNPSWGTYSTRFFENFPNRDNPYAKLSPHANPERLLLMTGIRPKGAQK